MDLGVDLVELDVHPTADGNLAVIHDRTLERTTNGVGPVAAHTAAALRALRLRGPDGALTDEGVPMLGEVLAAVAPSRVGLLVEIKDPESGPRYARRDSAVTALPIARYGGLAERVLEALAAAGLSERATIMAFNPAVITAAQAAAGRRTCLLVGRADLRCADARPEETVAWARAAGATDLGLDHTLVDGATVGAAHAAGLALGVWTVNDESEMTRLIDLGVDVITTDRPDLARRRLGATPRSGE
jgi:glycerophosphoryl diester phosphodiesterase